MAAAAAGLIAVAGCHVPGTSSASGPGPTGTVTVVAPPGVADAPLYIGVKDGFFRKAGLTVRVVSTSSARAEVAALKAGHADVAFGDYADMFYAQEQAPSLHLEVVADGYDAGPNVMEVLALPGSHISSPAGLVGKSVGTAAPQEMPAPGPASQTRPFSLDTVATWSVLSSDNVRPVRVHWAPMPASSLISALKLQQVDAILATEPTIYEAESQLGAVPVLDSCTGATENLPLDGYFTTGVYASRHGQAVAAFRAALDKAQAEAALAAPLQAALTKSAGLSPQTAALVTFGEYPTTLSAGNLQRVVNLMVTFGALGTNLSVASMLAK